MIRFACPHCDAIFTAADEKAGKITTCPKCREQFQVPVPLAKPLPARKTSRPRPAEHDIEDEDDDRPVPRNRRRDDDDDDDDRPRNRRRDDDDDDDRPRKKRPKSKQARRSGAILACGIVCVICAALMGLLAGLDADKLASINMPGGGNAARMRNAPKEVRSAASQLETAILFLNVATYGSILTAIVYLAGGVGLIMHQLWGRTATFAGCGLSIVMMLSMLLYLILILTVSINGKSPPFPTKDVLNFLLRFTLHLVPVIFAALVLFNFVHTKRLRS